jgi:palmitoyltransferase
MYAKNKFGINMLHVAAQGDQPISLYYFKNKGLSLRSRDDRQSTPLHWAIYSRSENALCYLLAWLDEDLEDKDVDEYTALHLAIKSVDYALNTRSVRALLIKGARRDAVDKTGKRAMDHVSSLKDDTM